MKRLISSLCFVGMLALLTACGPKTPELSVLADEAMNGLLTELNAVGLSVAVVKDNQIVYTGAFGKKSIEDGSLIGTDDLFRIASISKSFVATGMMQQLELGKYGLDDDVSTALGIPVRNPKFPNTPITYRMLLSHTSSLSDDLGYFTVDVIDPKVTKDVAPAYNDYAPGTQYEYCNLGFNLLGALLEIHSGERFDQYIVNHILQPLSIVGGYNVDQLDKNMFVSIYEYNDGVFTHSPDAYRNRAAEIENDYRPGRTTPIFSPTGGMKIAPKDLAKHMLVQMNQGSWNGVNILKPESVVLMQTPYSHPELQSDYGFAIRTTEKLIDGELLKGHTGSAYGLYSAMFFEPVKGFGFIMMTNGAPAKYGENGFLTVQSEVINKLYEIFVKQ